MFKKKKAINVGCRSSTEKVESVCGKTQMHADSGALPVQTIPEGGKLTVNVSSVFTSPNTKKSNGKV